MSDTLEISPPDPTVTEFIAKYNDVSPEVMQQFLHKYILKSEPERHAHLASSDEPLSRVLGFSYDELDGMLMEGLVAAI
jgi:hypothetical protein